MSWRNALLVGTPLPGGFGLSGLIGGRFQQIVIGQLFLETTMSEDKMPVPHDVVDFWGEVSLPLLVGLVGY